MEEMRRQDLTKKYEHIIDGLKRESAEHAELITNFRTENFNLSVRIAQNEQDMISFKKESSTTITKYNSDLSNALKQNEILENRVKELESSLTNSTLIQSDLGLKLDSLNSELKNVLVNYERQNNELRESKELKQNILKSNEETDYLNKLKDELINLFVGAGRMDYNIALKQSNAELSSELTSLVKRLLMELTILKDQAMLDKNKVALLESEIRSGSKSIANKDKLTYNGNLDDTDYQYWKALANRMSVELDELMNRIGLLNNQIKLLESTRVSADDISEDAARKEIAALKSRLAISYSEKEKFNAYFADKEKESDRLLTAIEQLTKANEAKLKRIEHFESEMNLVVVENNQLKIQIDKLTKQRNKLKAELHDIDQSLITAVLQYKDDMPVEAEIAQHSLSHQHRQHLSHAQTASSRPKEVDQHRATSVSRSASVGRTQSRPDLIKNANSNSSNNVRSIANPSNNSRVQTNTQQAIDRTAALQILRGLK